MNRSSHLHRRTPDQLLLRRRIRERVARYASLILSIILTATYALIESADQREPYHTSALTGEEWVVELLSGHPERIHCELGVHLHVFDALVSELRDLGHGNSRHVSLEEQLAIFLYSCVTGLTIRHVGERFQRSNDTISRYFKKILIIFASPPFYSKHVRLPSADDPVSPHIRESTKFWPFFKDALGAIDGSHIHSSPPAAERASHRNRKGFVSQNCLFVCTFELYFAYAYTGWEGSATDARIFEAARSAGSGDLVIPEGKYYLADAGFPSCNELLIPYRGVRYHLAEWGRAGLRPKNKEELFNLRHSSARNAIERIFGVLKRRFRILLLAPEYNLDIQAQIPAALCAVHNFIRAHDFNEGPLTGGDEQHRQFDDYPEAAADQPGLGEESGSDGLGRRDEIAQEMWKDYQRVCRERGFDDVDVDDEDDEMDLMIGDELV